MPRILRTPAQILGLIVLFLYELVASSLRVAWEVLTPRTYARPGIIAVPIGVRSDIAITVLANLISLTPGSLVLGVSSDRRSLFVHMMFIDEPDAERRSIQRGFERRVLEVLE